MDKLQDIDQTGFGYEEETAKEALNAIKGKPSSEAELLWFVLVLFVAAIFMIGLLAIYGSLQQEPMQPVELKGCESLPQKLERCQPYTCNSTDAQGTMWQIEVEGMEGTSCIYKEISDHKTFRCEYTEPYRRAVSQYFKDQFNDIEAVYRIGYQKIPNPYAHAFEIGQCTTETT